MTRTPSRTLPRLLAALVAVAIAAPTVPAAAAPAVPAAPPKALAAAAPAPTPTASAAADPAKPSVTWSVQPADQNGPDGRRWIERTLDPGQVVTEHLAVRNFSDSTVVFSLKTADGYLTDKGRFNMLPSNERSVDGGTWITVQEKVSVGPKQTTVVPFTITVPADASPGDHPAGIAATVTSSGGTVAVESRVGFRVMLRASGTITASMTIDDLTATYTPSWNPFASGTVKIGWTATNTGNVSMTGAGRTSVAELFGLVERDTPTEVEEMLRGGNRTVETRVGGVWGLGPVRTTVEVTPAVLGGDATGAEIRTASATVTTWALPWAQLILVLLLGALAFAARTVVRRRRQRLAQLLDKAREEGRAQARETGREAVR
ncbi:DUF916 domain-containing protein [Micromonospora endophytica]|uniref:DUF916 domain-containing protein n=1 Tax=Micromonospora endophytica TaxID=515350 RepID=UPI001C31EB48|nr:DUF916 domain-containing protein [Micromonospora endophytica]BCJ59693.1 hypothetical protein Jiend_31150 [Micromonospora endophytica]